MLEAQISGFLLYLRFVKSSARKATKHRLVPR